MSLVVAIRWKGSSDYRGYFPSICWLSCEFLINLESILRLKFLFCVKCPTCFMGPIGHRMN